jgi:YggT family protein
MTAVALSRLEVASSVSAASYVSAVFTVYIVLIFAYILVNLMLSFGLRLPYARWSDVLLNFLRDVSEPYLRVFRRFIPPMGAFDLSPMIAIIVLYVVRGLVVSAVGG